MKVVVRLNPLVLNIIGDGRFRSVSGDCIDKVSTCPKLASPEFLLHFRVFLEHCSANDALHHLDNVLRKHHRDGLYKKMDMILIGTNFEKVYIISLCDLKTGLFDRLVNTI